MNAPFLTLAQQLTEKTPLEWHDNGAGKAEAKLDEGIVHATVVLLHSAPDITLWVHAWHKNTSLTPSGKSDARLNLKNFRASSFRMKDLLDYITPYLR